MSTQIVCPQCWALVTAREGVLSARCPKCGVAVPVPATERAELPPAAPAPPAPAGQHRLPRILAALAAAAVLTGGVLALASLRTKPALKSAQVPARERDPESQGYWTKTHTPAWTERIPVKVKDTWMRVLRSDEPVYTGILCTDREIVICIDRKEWRQLTPFQARNQAMLPITLPHTDKTLITFLDDSRGGILMQYTPKQPMDTIKVIHP